MRIITAETDRSVTIIRVEIASGTGCPIDPSRRGAVRHKSKQDSPSSDHRHGSCVILAYIQADADAGSAKIGALREPVASRSDTPTRFHVVAKVIAPPTVCRSKRWDRREKSSYVESWLGFGCDSA